MPTVTSIDPALDLTPVSFHMTRIAGSVKVEGEPARRRPRLYKRASGFLVAETESAADGTFEFLHIPPGRYTVMAVDPGRNFNAVVVDDVAPVPLVE